MRRLLCWWEGFAGTWLDPSMWATRFRILLTPGGPPLHWPGIVYSGHRLDSDHPRFEVAGDREYEWLTCARCGSEEYQGWRRYYGVAR